MNSIPSHYAAILLLLITPALRAPAQGTLYTIVSNAPSANRYNIVVLSEGYTSSQLSQFRIDATNAINALFTSQPYQEYQPYFNAYAIAVASTNSGSDHPAWPLYKNTYFNSTYDASSDLIITIPAGSQGQGKVDALLQTFVPDYNLSILLVNDITPGGSDGGSKTAISSISGLSGILVHETGHVVAGLGDEYTVANPGYPNTEEPNTTRETNRTKIKWNVWISTNTPVPTPPVSQFDSVVGLFQGAHYHTNGWYRPKLNCTMQSPGYQEFCEVCQEATVLAFYRKVRPIDAFSPQSKSLSVTNTASLTFNLSLLQPATHSLNIRWFTNGIALPDATNQTLTCWPKDLKTGSNWVSVVTQDNTALVRNDPTNLLAQTVGWSVNVPYLQLDSPIWLAGGKFAFRVSGNAPQGFAVQAATNLLNWASISTNTLANGQFWFTNSVAGSSSNNFFRAKTPP